VLGPVRFLALGIAIRCSFAARALQVFGSHFIIEPFTVRTTDHRTLFGGEAISVLPSIIDFCNTLVGNEPTFVIRANWNTRHLIDLVSTLIVRVIASISQVWSRDLRTNPALEIRARLFQLMPLSRINVFPEISEEAILHATATLVLGQNTSWKFQTLGYRHPDIALL
jgi:hypothetical protein